LLGLSIKNVCEDYSYLVIRLLIIFIVVKIGNFILGVKEHAFCII